MMDIKEDWLLWFINLFDKKTAGIGIKSMPQNEQLVDKLHQSITRIFKTKKSIFNIQRQYLGY